MTQSTLKATESPPPFEEHLRSTAGSVRSTLLDLMTSIGVNPNRPQEIARRLGLRSGLTWKVCKVLQEPNIQASVPHIPGPAGLKLFLNAFEKAGAPTESVDAARNAATAFDKMIKVHTGDRQTLMTMLGQLSPPNAEHSEQARKLAFQGNSGTWGVRARVQLGLNILAPNANDPTQCDLAQIAGLISFRRLRRDARWLLFRRERWTDDAPQMEEDVWEPIDPSHSNHHGVPFINEYCSKPLPEIDVLLGKGEDQYELPPGPVGNTAAMTLVYGLVAKQVGPAYAMTPGECSEFGSNLVTPAEHVLFDLMVHREFDWAMQPELAIYSRMDGGAMHASVRRDRNILPVPEIVQDLGWGASAMATPLWPKYGKLVDYTFNQLQWNSDNFRTFRLIMHYPPIPTTALLLSELPVRRGGKATQS